MHVLMIDSDRALAAGLTAALRSDAFEVESTADAQAAIALIAGALPDLVVLNVRLAGGLSLDLLRAMRAVNAKVLIVLLGRGDEDARVRGLAAGADDYLSLPVSPRELAARIRALLQHHDDAVAAPSPLIVGPLRLDAATHVATLEGASLDLTVTEFRLLQHLMAHAGRVVTFATLLQEVWGYQDVRISDVVRTAVYRLRQKLHDDPTATRLLHTIPGVGFILRFEPPGGDGRARPDSEQASL